jgi:hypothetical protein
MPGFGVLIIPGSMDELWRCAKIGPVARVMRPYLEALSWCQNEGGHPVYIKYDVASPWIS